MFLFAGMFVCFDTGLIIYQKEMDTNLHNYFKSVQRQCETAQKKGTYSVADAKRWYQQAMELHNADMAKEIANDFANAEKKKDQVNKKAAKKLDC